MSNYLFVLVPAGFRELNAILTISICGGVGTSMSCPHVSGVAAQYLQREPQATPAQVWLKEQPVTHLDDCLGAVDWHKGGGGRSDQSCTSRSPHTVYGKLCLLGGRRGLICWIARCKRSSLVVQRAIEFKGRWRTRAHPTCCFRFAKPGRRGRCGGGGGGVIPAAAAAARWS